MPTRTTHGAVRWNTFSAEAFGWSVRTRGDAAVREFNRKYDRAALDDFRVGADEIAASASKIPTQVARAIESAAMRIENYHRAGMAHGHYYPSPEQVFFWIALGIGIGYSRIAETLPALVPVTSVKSARRRSHPRRMLEPALR